MGLKKEIGRANILFSIGKVISAGIAFFLNIYLARSLQPYEFGLYSFALVIISAAMFFTDFGINTVLLKFGSEEKYQKDFSLLKRLFSATLKYKVILSFLVSAMMIVFSDRIAVFFGKTQTIQFIILSSIILFSASVAEYIFYFFTMMKSFRNQSMFRIIEQMLKAAGIVFFVAVGLKAYGALMGNALSYILLVLIMGGFIIRKYPKLIRAKPKALELERLRAFGIWSVIGMFTGTVYGMLDKLMISKMLPVESLGFYQLAYTWLFAITYIIPLAPQVMLTYYSNNMNSRKRLTAMIANSIKYTGILSFPFSFLLSAFSGAFIIFLYGSSYLPAASALKILSLMVTPMLFVMFFSNYFSSINRQDVPAKIFAILSVPLFALGLLLIPAYGITGVAYALLFVKLIELAVYSYLLFFREKIRFSLDIVWKPMLASAIVYAILDFALPRVFKEISLFNFILSGSAAFSLYVLLMLAIKGITNEELRAILSLAR